MATKIIPKKSSVVGKTPLTSDLDIGEVAINLADKKIFTKDAAGDILQLGNTEEARIPIQADVALVKGDLVYATGAVEASGKITVNKFIANNTIEELAVIGLAERDLAINESGFAITFGEINRLDTTGDAVSETWVEGTILYASPTTAGKLTYVKPEAPNQNISVAIVIRAHATTGIIFVKPITGFHLGELHDLHVPNPTEGQVLAWDNANERWEAKSSGSGTVTSVAASGGTGISITGSPITTNGTITVTNTAPNVTTNLSTTHNASTIIVNSSDGTNATVNAATTSLAGVLSSTDKNKLDGIAAGAQVNVATNLGITGTGNTRTITSSTGTNVTVPVATTTTAGLLSTSDKTKLDGIATAEKVGTITGTTLDLTSGNVFSYTPTAETTFVFSNPPTTGTTLGFTLELNGEFIDGGYDLANAEPPAYGYFSVAAQETGPTDIFFKPDGTKMYVLGNVGDDVNEYDLSTAWDVSSATYLQNFSVAAQEATPQGIFFKPDGLKMYVIGNTGDDVNEYDLSTAWDITSATYLQNFSVSAQEATPQGIFFKPDGTKMYVIGLSGDDVNEYDLSTAWDISTASYLQNFSVAAQEIDPQGIFFKPDGLKMYVIGNTADNVNEYVLSTAWDITTASYLQNFSVAAQETNPQGIFFKPDGTKMYVLGTAGDAVFSYTLSTAWDVSAASFDFPTEGYFSVAAQETSPQGMFFKPDGTKMYIIGASGDDVNEYDLSTAWDINSASYLQNFSVAAQEAAPSGIFFKPDGLKMYVIGFSGDDVNEYDLSTAWDVSTASYLQNFSVSAQETDPTGVFFKSDGLKMYVLGASGRDVNEYDLSTAWDVSSASYLQNFSVSAQETGPTGIFFKPDGTKMYVIGISGDDVNEYDLSTAWDITSASYLQNFSVSAQETGPTGVFFKPDGTKMYVIGDTGDAVWQYSTGFVGDATFTYPASVEWPAGTPPTSPADGETDLLRFLTQDGGTTYYGRLIGDNFS